MKEAEARMKALYAQTGQNFNQISQKTQQQQQQREQPAQQGKVSGFFSKFFHKEAEEEAKPQRGSYEISGPVNVKHEGFVRFDKQGGNFQTQNLPKEYQEIFDAVNSTLTGLGVSGITEKEAKLILKALPAIVSQNAQTKPRSESIAAASTSFWGLGGLTSLGGTAAPVEEPAVTVSEPRFKEKVEVNLGGPSMGADLQDLLNMIKSNEKTINGLRNEKSELAKKLNELVKANRELEESKKSSNEEITSLRSDINMLRSGKTGKTLLDSDVTAAVQEKTQAIQQENQSLKSKVSTLESQLDELKQQLEAEKDQVNRLALQNKVLSPPPPLSPDWDHNLPPPPPLFTAPATVSSAPPPAPLFSAPPPPPTSVPPPPPPTANSLASQMGNVKLTAPTKSVPPPPVKDDRSDLLNAIRGGNKLRHVTEEEKVVTKPQENSVASLIARALIERRNVIKNDDQDDGSNDNLEDWL
eukprot:TRINITY_DN1436_c0_g1_i1.p1 TRINITY_DN1436_c0_g1~~TRINITY_DN1436_c0_g1_i1.p1  ORF type:complete len:511 (-),score=233.13 TRINITY_DN1436_c0_g1_i1:59-1468(-)